MGKIINFLKVRWFQSKALKKKPAHRNKSRNIDTGGKSRLYDSKQCTIGFKMRPASKILKKSYLSTEPNEPLGLGTSIEPTTKCTCLISEQSSNQELPCYITAISTLLYVTMLMTNTHQVKFQREHGKYFFS